MKILAKRTGDRESAQDSLTAGLLSPGLCARFSTPAPLVHHRALSDEPWHHHRAHGIYKNFCLLRRFRTYN
eukprot:1158856-Pelagomonas_calceolata.AAC.6